MKHGKSLALVVAQQKALAESLYTTAIANQRKANLAAEIAGKSPPFSNLDDVAGVSKSCWA